MDDRTGGASNPDLAGRPTLIRGNSQLLFAGMGRLSENGVISIKNKSFSVTAEIMLSVPDGGANSVIIAQGGRPAAGRLPPRGAAGDVHLQRARHPAVHDHGQQSVPEWHAPVRMEFAYDGGGLAKSGDVTLYYDGAAAGSGRVRAAQPMVFSA